MNDHYHDEGAPPLELHTYEVVVRVEAADADQARMRVAFALEPVTDTRVISAEEIGPNG